MEGLEDFIITYYYYLKGPSGVHRFSQIPKTLYLVNLLSMNNQVPLKQLFTSHKWDY